MKKLLSCLNRFSGGRWDVVSGILHKMTWICLPWSAVLPTRALVWDIDRLLATGPLSRITSNILRYLWRHIANIWCQDKVPKTQMFPHLFGTTGIDSIRVNGRLLRTYRPVPIQRCSSTDNAMETSEWMGAPKERCWRLWRSMRPTTFYFLHIWPCNQRRVWQCSH